MTENATITPATPTADAGLDLDRYKKLQRQALAKKKDYIANVDAARDEVTNAERAALDATADLSAATVPQVYARAKKHAEEAQDRLALAKNKLAAAENATPSFADEVAECNALIDAAISSARHSAVEHLGIVVDAVDRLLELAPVADATFSACGQFSRLAAGGLFDRFTGTLDEQRPEYYKALRLADDLKTSAEAIAYKRQTAERQAMIYECQRRDAAQRAEAQRKRQAIEAKRDRMNKLARGRMIGQIDSDGLAELAELEAFFLDYDRKSAAERERLLYCDTPIPGGSVDTI